MSCGVGRGRGRGERTSFPGTPSGRGGNVCGRDLCPCGLDLGLCRDPSSGGGYCPCLVLRSGERYRDRGLARIAPSARRLRARGSGVCVWNGHGCARVGTIDVFPCPHHGGCGYRDVSPTRATKSESVGLRLQHRCVSCHASCHSGCLGLGFLRRSGQRCSRTDAYQ